MNYPPLETIKWQAKVMKEFLRKGEHTVSMSACYSCIAQMYGFLDWNHFSKVLKDKGDKVA
jgi:hypothetical protein